jgi:uncharacterized membrane protein
MDPGVRAVLAVLMRWIHITSIVTLIGGFVYARLALAPALASLPDADREAFSRRVTAVFRPLLYTVMVTALGSGLYNYLTKAVYPERYHMWMGIKLLIVLHIFSAAILYARPSATDAKRSRTAAGLVLSGLVVIAISAYLRWISF